MENRIVPSAKLLALAALSAALLSPCRAQADLAVAGPATPTAQMLGNWYQHRLPACFAARDTIMLYPLADRDMDDYLASVGLSDGASCTAASSSDGEIDGLYVERQNRISVRVNAHGGIDMETLSHEYGHYVWLHLLSKAERGEYRGIYEQQSRANELVSEYAYTNLDEGFAEAFAYFVVDPAKLSAADPASYQFMLGCAARRGLVWTPGVAGDTKAPAAGSSAGAAAPTLAPSTFGRQNAAAIRPASMTKPLSGLILSAIRS